MSLPNLALSFINQYNSTYIQNLITLPNAPYLIAAFICTNIILCKINDLCLQNGKQLVLQILSLNNVMDGIASQQTIEGKRLVWISFIVTIRSILNNNIKLEDEYVKDIILDSIMYYYDKLSKYFVNLYLTAFIPLSQLNTTIGIDIMSLDSYNHKTNNTNNTVEYWIKNLI